MKKASIKKFSKKKLHFQNRKKLGFTMVELLAVIVILGILTTIVILSFSNLTSRSRKEYYSSQEEMIVLAAREYYSDYRSKLPKNIGNISSVSIQTLIALDYIDEVMGYDNELCNVEDSLVKVLKVTEEDYQYEAQLICNDYSSEVTIGEDTDLSVNISSSTSGENGYRIKTYDETNKNQEVELVLGKKKLTFHINVNNNAGGTVASYQYYVKKEGQNSNYISSPEITVNSNSVTADVDVIKEGNITEDGSYSLIVEATDASGNTISRSSSFFELDNVPPDCEFETDKNTSKSVIFNVSYSSDVTNQVWEKKNWISGSSDTASFMKATMNKDQVQFTSSDLGYNVGRLTVTDLLGNYCEVTTDPYKILLDAPSVSAPSDWQACGAVPVIAEIDEDDDSSKVAMWQVKSSNSNTWQNISSSNAKGNITYSVQSRSNALVNEGYSFRVCLSEDDDLCSDASSSKQIKIDCEAPSCTTSGGNGGAWTNQNITLTGTCNDGSGSGCQGNVSRTISSNTESSESPGTVTDLVGNSRTCPAETIRVDKTPPVLHDYNYDFVTGGYYTVDAVARTVDSNCGKYCTNCGSINQFTIDFYNIRVEDNESGVATMKFGLLPTYSFGTNNPCGANVSNDGNVKIGGTGNFTDNVGNLKGLQTYSGRIRHSVSLDTSRIHSGFRKYMFDWIVSVQVCDQAGNCSNSIADTPVENANRPDTGVRARGGNIYNLGACAALTCP